MSHQIEKREVHAVWLCPIKTNSAEQQWREAMPPIHVYHQFDVPSKQTR